MSSGLGKIRVVSGMPTPQGGQDPGTLPGTTTNFVKLLEEQGFEVDVTVPKEDRQYVDLNSAEIWLPVLILVAQPAWDLTVLAIIGAIKSLYSSKKVGGREEVDLPPGVLHLQCTFEEADGSRREFDGHGPAGDVVKALKAFGN